MPFTSSTEPRPPTLHTSEFSLRPIVVADAERDYAAVMATREPLRQWRQSTWPEDDFTVEANRLDLIELEERHAAGRAFTYTVLDPAGVTCLGCVYVYATGATFLARAAVTPVGDDEWAGVDAVVFFWVRQQQMHDGTDGRLLTALRDWFRDVWHFDRTVFATSEPFTQQVSLLRDAGLTVRFELQEPDKPARRLVFG